MTKTKNKKFGEGGRTTLNGYGAILYLAKRGDLTTLAFTFYFFSFYIYLYFVFFKKKKK
jgi:hypothetical protein